MIAKGNKVVASLTMSGTQQGEFPGMPASGRLMSVIGIDIVRFADEKAWRIGD